jgi:excisionase family DNA binding protein
MAKGKNVLTTGDVARICNVAPRTVSKWFDNGRLKGYRIPGSKDRRIPLNELIRFMRVHNMPTDELVRGDLRLLLVDGGNGSTEVLADILRRRGGYDVQIVAGDFQTGAAVQKFNPQVVVINLLSRDVQAQSICQSIRGDDDLRNIRIIGMGERLSESECRALIQQGFDAYVSCSTDASELIRKVEEITST